MKGTGLDATTTGFQLRLLRWEWPKGKAQVSGLCGHGEELGRGCVAEGMQGSWLASAVLLGLLQSWALILINVWNPSAVLGQDSPFPRMCHPTQRSQNLLLASGYGGTVPTETHVEI